MKNTITKWLLFKDDSGAMKLEEREVNKYIPINRMLDEVGYYQLESIQVLDSHYMIVYNPKYPMHNQPCILVSKIGVVNNGEGLIDLKSEDYPHMQVIAKHYLRTSPLWIQ